MGTSASYIAPTTGNWPQAKRIIGQFSKQGGAGGIITTSQVADAYVSALGGATSAAQSAISGREAASGLGAFLADVSVRGLSAALAQVGLGDFVGRDTPTVLMGLVDKLAGAGTTLDEATARQAMEAVLSLEVDQVDTYDQLENLLNQSLDNTAMMRIFGEFLVEYIYIRLIRELGARIESGAINPATVAKIERDLRDYISAAVKLKDAQYDFSKIAWQGQEGQNLVEQLFREAYEQL